MTDLSEFPITKRWPAQHPDRIQLYSLNTPNGVKVSISLEELDLPYEPHLVDFSKADQKTAVENLPVRVPPTSKALHFELKGYCPVTLFDGNQRYVFIVFITSFNLNKVT